MNRLDYLEGLRGYMSIWVFLTHALTIATLPLDKEYGLGKLLVNGDLPVMIFIILSGFVTHILLDKKETYKIFIIRRAFRLFPIYLVCLVISIFMLDFSKETLLSIPWQHAKNISRIDIIDIALNNDFIINVLSHIFLVHGLIPNNIIPTTYTIMGQSWSLTLEWQFYLAVPVLHYFITKKTTLKYNLIFTFILLLSVFVARIYMPQKSFLPNMLHYFAIGYFSYFFYKRYLNGEKKSLYIFLVFVALLEIQLNYLYGLIIIFWLITIHYQLNKNKFSDFLFSNKLALFLGKVSYSAYCIHMIILFATSFVLINIFLINDQVMYSVLLILISTPVTIFTSSITYKFIEVPFMKYAKSIKVR